MAAGGKFYSDNANEVEHILNRLTRTLRQLDISSYEKPILENILTKIKSPEFELESSEKELLEKILERRIHIYMTSNDRFINELDSIIIDLSNLPTSELIRVSNALKLMEMHDEKVTERINKFNDKIIELIDKKK